jgi:hypothetical protein
MSVVFRNFAAFTSASCVSSAITWRSYLNSDPSRANEKFFEVMKDGPQSDNNISPIRDKVCHGVLLGMGSTYALVPIIEKCFAAPVLKLPTLCVSGMVGFTVAKKVLISPPRASCL